MGGEIWVESEPGRAASSMSFCRLPQAHPEPGHPGMLEGGAALMVDDNLPSAKS